MNETPLTQAPASITTEDSESDVQVPSGIKNLVQPVKGYKIKNILLVLMTIVVLIGGVAAGVILVNHDQDIRERAATQICLDSNNCVLEYRTFI